ncbi:MAG: hypothetical protein ACTHMS_03250 [Jatrophihabitans sp.]|uniref:hypothetical protein n=1 Tax=Jatrophihabitans sp. TaxID=1932789 RepID=UPI003F7D300A
MQHSTRPDPTFRADIPDALQAADLFDTLASGDLSVTIHVLEDLLATLRAADAARAALARTPIRTLEVALDLRRRRAHR